jgi:RNA polymerase sigma-70 factor (ECF subfamily)
MEQNRQFATTQWSIVRQAGAEDAETARSALQQLCQSYWYPLYSFVRFRGYDAATAEDLTQSFFARLLQREDIPRARPEKGRFRSWLLAAMKNFLANEWDRKNAQKRGGDRVHFSMDFAAADSRYRFDAVSGQSPELNFERQWALTLLDRVGRQLRAEYEKRGKAHVYDSLQVFLAGRTDEATMADVAMQLEMSEIAVKVAVHRMRARFGHLLRLEIQSTLDSHEDIEDEIARLFEALRT